MSGILKGNKQQNGAKLGRTDILQHGGASCAMLALFTTLLVFFYLL